MAFRELCGGVYVQECLAEAELVSDVICKITHIHTHTYLSSRHDNCIAMFLIYQLYIQLDARDELTGFIGKVNWHVS